MDKAQAQIIHTLAQDLTASTPKGRGELVQRAALPWERASRPCTACSRQRAGTRAARRDAMPEKAP